jgi:recombination associated protein RdgC
MKNLTIFKTEKGWTPTAEFDRLINNLSEPNQTGTGWQVLHDGTPLIDINGQIMLIMEVQEKKVPPAVLKRETQLRLEKLAQSTGNAGVLKSGKIRKEIMNTVYNELYARAFLTSKLTKVWVDSVNGYLCIDSVSETNIAQAMKLLSFFRNTRIVPLETVYHPRQTMRKLLLGEVESEHFYVGNSCEIYDRKLPGRSIIYKNEQLSSQELMTQLQNGRAVKKLSLEFDDKIRFVLHENLCISGIKIIEAIEDAEEYESAEAKFNADFIIMTGMYSELIGAVVEALGGEQ